MRIRRASEPSRPPARPTVRLQAGSPFDTLPTLGPFLLRTTRALQCGGTGDDVDEPVMGVQRKEERDVGSVVKKLSKAPLAVLWPPPTLDRNPETQLVCDGRLSESVELHLVLLLVGRTRRLEGVGRAREGGGGRIRSVSAAESIMRRCSVCSVAHATAFHSIALSLPASVDLQSFRRRSWKRRPWRFVGRRSGQQARGYGTK